MEALACGCQVFSSINGGLSDYLDPGFNCYKIAGYSQEFDAQRILKALKSEIPLTLLPEVLHEYRSENIIRRFAVILAEINHFFDHKPTLPSPIKSLTRLRLAKLFTQKVLRKLKQKWWSDKI
jgi:glycosyltransferase involved in cell wall biosynthesis